MCKPTGWWSCVTPHDDAADKRKWGSIAVVMATVVITGSCFREQWSEPPTCFIFVSFQCCGLRFPLQIWISCPDLQSPLSFSICVWTRRDRDWGRRSLVHRFVISGTGYSGKSGCSQSLHHHLEQRYIHACSFSITGICAKRVDGICIPANVVRGLNSVGRPVRKFSPNSRLLRWWDNNSCIFHQFAFKERNDQRS